MDIVEISVISTAYVEIAIFKASWKRSLWCEIKVIGTYIAKGKVSVHMLIDRRFNGPSSCI